MCWIDRERRNEGFRICNKFIDLAVAFVRETRKPNQLTGFDCIGDLCPFGHKMWKVKK